MKTTIRVTMTGIRLIVKFTLLVLSFRGRDLLKDEPSPPKGEPGPQLVDSPTTTCSDQ